MDLVKIKAADYGLEESKAKQISDMFKPMLDKMVDLEKEYNEIVDLPISKATTALAKDLRLRYVKVRTGTAVIHKDIKQFYIKGGKFVDGWKNTQLMASEGIEKSLKDIECHFENIEKEKREQLKAKREKELQAFELEVMPPGLGEMDEEIWNNFLTGTKANYEARIAAEKKAETDRIAAEKAEKAEQDRIRKENDKLKAEAKEKERLDAIAEKKRQKADAARIAKEAAEKKKRQEENDKEIAKIEAEKQKLIDNSKEKAALEKAKQKAKQEAILADERKKQAKLTAELKAKDEEARAAREAVEKQVQAELTKGDAAKLKDLLAELKAVKSKYSFKSKRNQKMFSDVCILLDKVTTHINKFKKEGK